MGNITLPDKLIRAENSLDVTKYINKPTVISCEVAELDKDFT